MKARLGCSFLTLVFTAALSAVPAAASTQPVAPVATAARTPAYRGPHIMPFTPPGTASPATAPAGAHLTYNGGRVVSNVKVVEVVYGAGSYLPQTTSSSSPSVSSFFTGITNSPYFDWLTEYNTNLSSQSPRTNQTIGRGTFGGLYTITPSAANNGSQIQDSNVISELSAQISAGHLPAPTTDAAGNTNTLYETFFRQGQSICQSGSCSLVPGGFCAYHGTVAAGGGLPEFYYSVEPDLTGQSGCGTSTDFNNTTSVASHEMIETVTDAEVGISVNASGPPLAWYDQTNGEIGDICNGQQGTVTGGDGIAYTVQKQFSNVANDCILTRNVAPTNDFSISANPNSLSLAANQAGTSTISTVTTAGTAQTVSLSVSGLPAGASASFNPPSVTSGASSTLSVNAGSAAAGTYSLTVKGTAASASHSVPLTLTIQGSSGGGGIANGGFEAGSLTGWTSAGAAESVVSSGCHSGTYCARLGSTAPTNGDSTLAQTFTAPSAGGTLSFWYKMTCPDTLTYDWAMATLKDNTANTTGTPWAKVCVTNAWTQLSAALAAGHSYTLTLLSHDDNYAGDATYTLFDDVAISAPTGGGGISNGGFESGLTGWTSAGTALSSGVAHSGTHSAQVGSTSPSTDSSLAQSFTAPSTGGTLRFWYQVHCPDTVTYDWATATLKDVTTNSTVTLLAKTCTNSGSWVQVAGSALTAGHSYTLTLASHDDNYPGDPTYTLFDDVTIG